LLPPCTIVDAKPSASPPRLEGQATSAAQTSSSVASRGRSGCWRDGAGEECAFTRHESAGPQMTCVMSRTSTPSTSTRPR
jgi:hypothetical protein